MEARQPIYQSLLRYWRKLDESWRVALIAFLAIRLLYALWSWLVLTLQPVAVQNFELFGEPVVSVFRLQDSQIFLYRREINAEVLTFEPVDEKTLTDRQTGTLWAVANGKAVQGKYEGSGLQPAKTDVSLVFPYHDIQPYPVPWLAMWQRFDVNWYLSVAEYGYGSTPGNDHFPPLFPLLIKVLQPIFGSSFLSGIFIAHLATFFSLKLLYDTFAPWGESKYGRRAILFFVIYPTFFFFFSVYSEPVFLLVSLLSFRAMKARAWAWAGFWTFCAILTRLQGVALLAPMMLLLWRDFASLRKPAAWIGLGVAGFGGLFYLYLRSLQVTEGAVPFVEPEWHARLVPPWQTYGYALQTILSGRFTFIDALNLAVASLFLFLLVWGWRKIPVEYNLYTALSLFIILIRIVETQPLISMSRYALTLFPAFYALSLAGESPLLRRAIVYPSILLHLYLSAQFFSWGWVA